MAKKNIQQTAPVIELRSVSELVPYARNARQHNNLAQLEAAIREFGFVHPIGITDTNEIVWGHGRLLAAQNLGIEMVPTQRIPSWWTPDQIKAFRLADNKLTEGSGWDKELLAAELRELEDVEFDFEALGFDDSELDELLGDIEDDLDDLTKEAPPTTKPAAPAPEAESPAPLAPPAQEQEQEAAPLADQKPTEGEPPREKYLELAVVMSEANYFEVEKLLNAVQSEFAYEQREDALMHVVRAYLQGAK